METPFSRYVANARQQFLQWGIFDDFGTSRDGKRISRKSRQYPIRNSKNRTHCRIQESCAAAPFQSRQEELSRMQYSGPADTLQICGRTAKAMPKPAGVLACFVD